MEKMRIEVDLLQLEGATMQDEKIIIPVCKNGIYLFKKQEGGIRAVLRLNAFPRKTQSQYGATHIVKRLLTAEERNRLVSVENVETPILGSVYPLKEKY